MERGIAQAHTAKIYQLGNDGATRAHPSMARIVTSRNILAMATLMRAMAGAPRQRTAGGFASHSPPSTTMIAPVIHEPPGEQRNATMFATSAGLPHRCNGIAFFA